MSVDSIKSVPSSFWLGWAITILISLIGGYGTATYTVARVMERVLVHDNEIARLRDRQEQLATKQDLREMRLDIVERISAMKRGP